MPEPEVVGETFYTWSGGNTWTCAWSDSPTTPGAVTWHPGAYDTVTWSRGTRTNFTVTLNNGERTIATDVMARTTDVMAHVANVNGWDLRPPLSEEEQEAERAEQAERNRVREEREAEHRRRTEERREREHQAQLRAEELLMSYLTAEQQAQYTSQETFDVEGSAGGLYRIHPGNVGNVRLLREGREVVALCAHPELDVHDEHGRHLGFLPNADVALAQMLALTTNEGAFCRVANIHWTETGAAEAMDHIRAAAQAS